METKLQRITLLCPDEIKHKTALNRLYDILTKINPQKSKEDIREYYFKLQFPEMMNIVLVLLEQTVVGFYTVSAYTYQFGKVSYRVLRTAIGLLDQFRGQKKSPTGKLCTEFIKYKMRHPFKSVVGVFFIENPFVYAMIAKRVKYLYPNKSLYEPEAITQIRKSVLQVHAPSEIKNDLVLRIYFKVFFTDADIRRIEQSKDKNLHFYVKINPAYADGYSVLTILPVTWQNVYFCFRFMLFEKIRKLFNRPDGQVA